MWRRAAVAALLVVWLFWSPDLPQKGISGVVVLDETPVSAFGIVFENESQLSFFPLEIPYHYSAPVPQEPLSLNFRSLLLGYPNLTILERTMAVRADKSASAYKFPIIVNWRDAQLVRRTNAAPRSDTCYRCIGATMIMNQECWRRNEWQCLVLSIFPRSELDSGNPHLRDSLRDRYFRIQVSGIRRFLSKRNRSFHIDGLAFGQSSKPLRLLVQSLRGVPEANGSRRENARENRRNHHASGTDPRWPIYFMFGGLIGGSLIAGCGIDQFYAYKRWWSGGLLALIGLGLSTYAIFWPLLFGGYGWPWNW